MRQQGNVKTSAAAVLMVRDWFEVRIHSEAHTLRMKQVLMLCFKYSAADFPHQSVFPGEGVVGEVCVCLCV